MGKSPFYMFTYLSRQLAIRHPGKHRCQRCLNDQPLRSREIKAPAHEVKQLVFIHLADAHCMVAIDIILAGEHERH